MANRRIGGSPRAPGEFANKTLAVRMALNRYDESDNEGWGRSSRGAIHVWLSIGALLIVAVIVLFVLFFEGAG
jgi:hypothetical protein